MAINGVITATNNTRELAELANGFISYIDRSPKTAETYARNIRQFLAWLRYEGITQPQRGDVIRWRDWLQEEHDAICFDPDTPAGWSFRKDPSGRPYKTRCEAATAAQYIRNVCQLFAWAASEGLYPDIAQNIHAPRLEARRHRKEALTAPDVVKIEEVIRTGRGETEEQRRRLLAIYLLAVTAGLRCIEISRVRIGDVEEIGGQAYIWITGKGHAAADASLPLAPEVFEAIKNYLEVRQGSKDPGAPLFTGSGNRNRGQKLEARTIGAWLKAAMKAAGYDSPRITAHSLRHTTATSVLEITGDIYATQQYMRHSSPATTEIYLHQDTRRRQADQARKRYEYYHQPGRS